MFSVLASIKFPWCIKFARARTTVTFPLLVLGEGILPSPSSAFGRGAGFLLICSLATAVFAQVPPTPDAGSVQEQLKLPVVPKKPAAAPQIRVAPQAGEGEADTPP